MIEGAIMGQARKLALGKFPGIQKTAKTLSSIELPELALPCSQIDNYLKCHHKTLIQQLMEAESESHK